MKTEKQKAWILYAVYSPNSLDKVVGIYTDEKLAKEQLEERSKKARDWELDGSVYFKVVETELNVVA